MKKIITLSFFAFFTFCVNAQIINFQDPLLETALLNFHPATTDVAVDANEDGYITVLEAQAVTFMNISDKDISSLEGLEYFSNLERLYCDNNFVTNLLPLQSLINLYDISFIANQLTNIDVIQNLPNLTLFECQGNGGIDNIDVSQLLYLEYLDCSSTNILEINIANNHNLRYLNVGYGPIESLFIKNGNEQLTSGGNLHFENTSNLNYICVDNSSVISVAEQWANYNGNPSNTYLDRVNSYCSFVPGGTSYVISGQNTYDANNNGCDISDEALPFLSFTINDGANSGNLISNASGNYSIAVPQGIYTVTPELSSYFTATPSNIVVDFSTAPNPTIQDFCITSNGTYNDLEVSILPLELARPGFDITYSIIYQNNGTTTLSGDINLSFNDDLVDYVNATPNVDTVNTGELIWNYTNLKPFEKRELFLTVNANTPTDPNFPLNNGDILNYVVTINSAVSDETPENNTFELNQTVVNSYDPNDKTCLEGKTILPSEVGDYVTYMIRFENNGTASAVNIVVKDVIDTAKYDMNSLTVLKGSHDFVTEIRDTNIVEFIFENIYLPFDDATNDGYISFKIKTLPTLIENDTFENKAEIYFDYNPAIVTNLEQTKVQSVLSLNDYEFSNSIRLFPNPASDTVNVFSDIHIEKIVVYDYLGKKILISNNESIDVKNFESGLYVFKVYGVNGKVSVKQFVKN